MNHSTGSTGNPETAATTLRRCHFCGGASLRRSRLRFSDLLWLLVLRLPVRCRRCSKRQFVFLTEVQRINAVSTPRTPEQHSEDSWQSFTANESPALRNDKHDEGER
jgi:hypothetical protein